MNTFTTAAPAALQPGTLIKIAKLKAVTCLSKGTIYRLVAEGSFPKQVNIGPRAVAWRSDDIIKWMKNLENAEG